MKKTIPLCVVLLAFLVLYSCKKTKSPTPAASAAACRLQKIIGNSYSEEFTYDTKGKIISITHFIGNHALQDSLAIGDNTVIGYNKNWPYVIQTTVYQGSLFDGNLPDVAHVAQQEGTVTRTDVWTYFFFYDNKDRLVKVGEQTDHVIGDFEGDYAYTYNDQDNVINAHYTVTTGPNVIYPYTVATSFDDKHSPYSGMNNRFFSIYSGLSDGYFITRVSKNNPLEIRYSTGEIAEMTYTYNDKGFPTSCTTTLTNKEGASSTSTQSFFYDCQ